MVDYRKEDDTHTISYSLLIPVLNKAIQEQQTIIEEQNSKIDNLELQIKELKELIINKQNVIKNR